MEAGVAELDGPRLEPPGGSARRLVVFLHGYGADGNDLIDIGRAWQGLLPDTAFVSPHAPEPCGPRTYIRNALASRSTSLSAGRACAAVRVSLTKPRGASA